MPVLESGSGTDLILALGAVSRRVFLTLPYPAFVIDRAERLVLEANAAACVTYGVEPGATSLYLGPEGIGTVQPAQRDEPAEGVRVETQRHVGADGGDIWMELLCIPLDGWAEGLELIVGRDVSARRRTVERLQVLQTAIDAATDIVVVSSLPAGDGSEAVVFYANPAFERLTGWRVDDIAGSCLSRLAHPDSDATHVEGFRSALAERRPYTGELLARRPDGSSLWVDVSMTPSRPEEGRDRCVWVVRDATERREAQAQTMHAARMEAVGLMAGGLAHDFSNLLTVMASAVQAAASSLPQDHAARVPLREAEMATSRAHALSGQMLALSRRDDAASRQVFDACDVVRDLEPLLQRLAGDVRVAAWYPAEPALVCADLGQVEQVVLNLVANARDAMPCGGTVDVSVLLEGDEVHLAVADAGIGMDAETIANATEAFFTTKPRGSGTGLGLSTVHTIAEQHGGRVEIASQPGMGTTVTVALPRSAEELPEPAPAPARGPDEAPVLLVEDNASLRRLLAASLRGSGLEVREEDGTGAVEELVAGGPYRLVVSDMRLGGGGTAVELLRALRRAQPEVPVLCISGQEVRGGALAGVEGNVVTLPKPFNLTELTEAVTALL